jgi:hypothetical protein
MTPTIADEAAMIAARGAATLPALIDPAAAGDLARQAERLIVAQAAVAEAGGLTGDDAFAFQVGTIHFGQLFDLPDGPRFLAALVAAFVASRGWRLFRTLLGPDVAMPLRLGGLRWHAPPYGASIVPHHQDANFTSRTHLFLNCWLTLTPAGGDHPGLEVAAAGVREDLPRHLDQRRATNRLFTGIELEPRVLAERVPADAWLVPTMAPGDAMMFDQWAPHRTSVGPAATGRRISVELRGCAADRLAADHPYPDRLLLRATTAGVAIDLCRPLQRMDG